MATYYNASPVITGLVSYLDAANPKSYSPNTHPYPLDLYSWVTNGYQQTLSRETSFSSPAGGMPLKIVTSGSSSYTGSYNSPSWNISTAAIGQTWTASFWVKGSSAHTASAMIFEANSSGNYTTLTQAYYNVTTEWTRVSVTRTLDQATTQYIQFRLDNYNTGVTMWVDGLQIERASAPTAFNKFTNPNGGTIYDLSGNGKNGTFGGGLTWASTDNGRFELNGVNSTINMGTGNTFFPLYDFTIEIWFRSTGTTATTGTNPGLLGGTYGMRTFVYANYINVGLNVNAPGSTTQIYTDTPSTFNFYNGSWHQLVFQAKSNLYNVFVDGQLAASAALSSWTGSTVWPTNTFNFGRDNNNTPYFFTGSISVTKIYNTFLSDGQVKQNFNALRGRYGI